MLVSNTTETFDKRTVMRDLISSCYEARGRFQSAAEQSKDDQLKRLFQIYAQQRTRFAEELREHLHSSDDDNFASGVTQFGSSGGTDSIRDCLQSDWNSLQLYKQALASRELPTRTHFVISSQLALLERAHERVSTLLQQPRNNGGHTAMSLGRIRA